MALERDKPLTIPQIAERWDCSQATVRTMVETGKLPCFRIGRMIRVPLRYVLEMESGGDTSSLSQTWTPANDGELWQKALERANAFDETKRLRAMLDEMESQRRYLRPKIDGIPRDKYMEWLRARIDRLDPIEEITEGKPEPW